MTHRSVCGARRSAFILLALAVMLALPAVALAQPSPPRLVVFEGFYNPG